MSRQATIKVSPSGCLERCRRIAQVLEESCLPKLVLHLVAEQNSATFEFPVGVSFRQLKVLLNTYSMNPCHMDFFPVSFCFFDDIIIFTDNTEVIDSSCMLT